MNKGDQTKARIIAAGLEQMRQMPEGLTFRGVARSLGIKHQLIIYHFKSLNAFRDAVANEAVRIKDARIIQYLIVTKNPAVDQLRDCDVQQYMAV